MHNVVICVVISVLMYSYSYLVTYYGKQNWGAVRGRWQRWPFVAYSNDRKGHWAVFVYSKVDCKWETVVVKSPCKSSKWQKTLGYAYSWGPWRRSYLSNCRAGTFRSNKISSSSKVRPLLSGSLIQHQIQHMRLIPPKRKPVLPRQFAWSLFRMYGIATVKIMLAAAWTAVAIAIVRPLSRVDEISEMITKQIGPTVSW